MARYVGYKIGKVHESHTASDYYCGRCGYPVTDHDSYCSECGGAFRECDADCLEDETRNLKTENAKLRKLVSHLMYVKPVEVTAIVHDGKLLRFDEMLAEVGMRFEADE